MEVTTFYVFRINLFPTVINEMRCGHTYIMKYFATAHELGHMNIRFGNTHCY